MSQETTDAPVPVMKDCPFCAEKININAKKCKYCGETIDVTLRIAEEAREAHKTKTDGSNIVVTTSMSNAATQQTTSTSPIQSQFPVYPPKSRLAYVILALLFGNFGFHNFYAGYAGRGIIQLLLCWTFVIWIWAIIEALVVTKDARGVPFV